ncbi:MAG: WD40 repeat domain-containing protein, partial [Verrucomicrobia bacterium]|nr:WD40 repeat domain-containing protein [Verrucomicrobiota bacterium]
DQLQSAQSLAKKAADEIPLAKAAIEAAEVEVKKAESKLEAARKSADESDKPIRTLAFSSDGLTLATAGDDQKVHTWSAESGFAVDTLQGHAGAVRGVSFLPTGPLASIADQTALIWNLAGDWTLERVIASGDAASPISDRVNALAFSPDGTLLATGSGEPSRGGEIKLWRIESGELAQELKNPHSDAVLALDFSPDGKSLASGAADKFAKVFDLTTGKLAKNFEGHTHHVLGVSWQRNGRVLASAGADKVIKVWDFVTGEQRKTITGFEKEVTSIRFLDASNEAIITSGDSQVRLIRDDGKNDVRIFGGAKDFIHSAAVTPDGRVVVGGGQDGVLRVWDGANAEPRRVFEPPQSLASGL